MNGQHIKISTRSTPMSGGITIPSTSEAAAALPLSVCTAKGQSRTEPTVGASWPCGSWPTRRFSWGTKVLVGQYGWFDVEFLKNMI